MRRLDVTTNSGSIYSFRATCDGPGSAPQIIKATDMSGGNGPFTARTNTVSVIYDAPGHGEKKDLKRGAKVSDSLRRGGRGLVRGRQARPRLRVEF